MFDTVDFLAHVWPFVLFKKVCETCKTICVHESIFNNESNDLKRINNYFFLIKRMVKHVLRSQRCQTVCYGGSNYSVVKI